MTRLVVIQGGYQTGKMPLARRLMADDPSLCLVHRDDVRRIIGGKVTEADITILMVEMARCLLKQGHPVVNCAWNLEPMDRIRWEDLAFAVNVPLIWLDVRRPDVAALIPPLAA